VNILIVDDEEVLQDVLTSLLRKEGYATFSATTGEEGLEHNERVAAALAARIGAAEEEVLLLSTGVIGARLPVERILDALPGLVDSAGAGGLDAFSRAILTTDTVPKVATARAGSATVTGAAKGSGMIHPDMATMFAFLLTDAELPPSPTELLRGVSSRTFERVTVDGDRYDCGGCKTRFPMLDGVPFLFADPGATLDEWRGRYHALIRQLEQETKLAETALREKDLPESTRTRLESICTAKAEYIGELISILKPLDATALTANHETYLALRTRLPSDQGLTTYYANLHRDWCWGKQENDESLRLVREGFGEHSPEIMLVLGAGGARLAYDLHRAYPSALTVASDFNPLLVLASAKITRGETLKLHEFPIAPKTSEDVARLRELQAPEAASDNFHLVLANALRAPFRAGTFDTLVTPWLVDILPESLSVQARRWNRLLSEGGRWVWFGSHAFRGTRLRDCISLEESQEMIEQSGFSTPEVIEAEIPYMVSPADRLGRREQVVVISAQKTKDVKAPARHVALPDWLVKADLPVPSSKAFQMEAVSTRIYAFVMSMIDGSRSIEDMAQLMEEQRLMTRQEAVGAIRGFLIRMYEQSESYSTL